MRSLTRYISALVLATLYLLIVLSPLAPLAASPAVTLHALSGECSGDCSLCGCSAERSASHSCCCWQKKQRHDQDTGQHGPACCKNRQLKNQQETKSLTSPPCQSKKIAGFSGFDLEDMLYDHFHVLLSLTPPDSRGTRKPVSLTDRPGDPPDPPPKLS